MNNSVARIAITPGEPAGIGPDLIIQLAQQQLPCELIVIADSQLLEQRAKLLNLPIKMLPYDPAAPAKYHAPSEMIVLPIALKTACLPSQLSLKNAIYVIETLTRAATGCLQNEFDALVTGPVHKGIINEAGLAFTGHTEFLAALAKTDLVVMMLATQTLRVALATTHLPLCEVAGAITPLLLRRTLEILHTDLQKYFNLPQPRIAICGLNPHAGEQGHLGREEIDIIIPVLEKLRESGMHLIGPLPADTIFIPHHLAQADVVLAMYHDQGLPVLKYAGFDHAVNVTLGLPFIRTSVDHGTALALAGTGQANMGSLLAAVQMATQFCLNVT